MDKNILFFLGLITVVIVCVSGCVSSSDNNTANNSNSGSNNSGSANYTNQYMEFTLPDNWIINSTDGGLMNTIYDKSIPENNGNPSIAGSIQVLNSENGGVNGILQDAQTNDSATITKKTINGNSVYEFNDPTLNSWNAIWTEGSDTGLYLTISSTYNKNNFDTVVNSMTLKDKVPS